MIRFLEKIRHWSLHTLIVTPFIVFIVAGGSISGYYSYRNSQVGVRELTGRLLREVSTHIEGRVIEFLAAPPVITRINSNLFTRGQFVAERPPEVEVAFLDYLQQYRVRGIFFGDEQGRGVAVFRKSDGGFESRVIEHSPIRRFFDLDRRGNRLGMSHEQNWDPRDRPWYTGAKNRDGVVWSPVYTFTDGVLGMTSSHVFRGRSGQFGGVVGVDLDLGLISDFLREIEVSPSGQAFIVEPDGWLVASSKEGRLAIGGEDGRELRRVHARDSGNAVVHEAVVQAQQQFGAHLTLSQSQPLSFTVGGNYIHVQFTPIRDQWGLDLILGVAIPEEDFMAHLTGSVKNTIGIVLLSSILYVLAGVLIVRMVTKPIQEMSVVAHSIAEGHFDQVLVIEWGEELRVLAMAFNSMAEHLNY